MIDWQQVQVGCGLTNEYMLLTLISACCQPPLFSARRIILNGCPTLRVIYMPVLASEQNLIAGGPWMNFCLRPLMWHNMIDDQFVDHNISQISVLKNILTKIYIIQRWSFTMRALFQPYDNCFFSVETKKHAMNRLYSFIGWSGWSHLFFFYCNQVNWTRVYRLKQSFSLDNQSIFILSSEIDGWDTKQGMPFLFIFGTWIQRNQAIDKFYRFAQSVKWVDSHI